jgi:hypothetical protein
MRRLVLTAMVALLAMGPASVWAQTPSGDKMKGDKMEMDKKDKKGGTMMDNKGDKMDKGMNDKGMDKIKDDKMEKMDKK